MSGKALLRRPMDHEKKPVKDVRLERALQARFFMLTLQIIDRDRMPVVQSEHLTWLLEQEAAGVVFLSGPAGYAGGDLPPEGQLNGFLVIRAGNIEDARKLAEQEPFIAQGVMAYQLYDWTVFQGAIAVTVQLSDGTGHLG